jgi:hypothetical protein
VEHPHYSSSRPPKTKTRAPQALPPRTWFEDRSWSKDARERPTAAVDLAQGGRVSAAAFSRRSSTRPARDFGLWSSAPDRRTGGFY